LEDKHGTWAATTFPAMRSGLIVSFLFLFFSLSCKKKEVNPFASVAGRWNCVEYWEIKGEVVGFFKSWLMEGDKMKYTNHYYYNATSQPTIITYYDIKFDIQTLIEGNKCTLTETYILTDSIGAVSKIPYRSEFELIEGQSQYGGLTFDAKGEKISIDHGYYGSSGYYRMTRNLVKIK
jgi:hypothetical protein